MVEWWVAVSLAAVTLLLGGAVGYVGHLLQSRVPTKDNQDTIVEQKRKDALEHFRWAAELAVSRDEWERQMGAAQLRLISEDPKLTSEEADRVAAALDVALAPAVEAWDTGETPQTEGEES